MFQFHRLNPNTQKIGRPIAVDEGRRALRIPQAQLRAVAVALLTVLNMEAALFAAEIALVQVRTAHLNGVWLFQSRGGGLSQPGGPDA
jgi:outer membrane protein TolC